MADPDPNLSVENSPNDDEKSESSFYKYLLLAFLVIASLVLFYLIFFGEANILDALGNLFIFNYLTG